MAIEITRAGKNALILETPVMPAAGTFGFGDVYRDLINFEKLGALVTNPVSYEPRNAAHGVRVVRLDSGVLLHTGLPNLGINKVLRKYRNLWGMLPLPIIVHLIATTPDHVRKSAARLDEEEGVDALELGLNDDISLDDAADMIHAATSRSEKPVMVRLPTTDTMRLAKIAIEEGASTLVACATPRGTARDPLTGKMISGRIYGPIMKPMILRIVAQLAEKYPEIPIIGSGGIHSPQDARDFISAGAKAVQVDTLTWIQPHLLEHIARDLGGWIVTRENGALPDEWHPSMGDTEKKRKADTGYDEDALLDELRR
ncbi:MAG: hypothetical protein SH821_13500 [Phototrophicales bacterium]|nr:hypothetical protein [Phototrophicales bacterium]